MEESHKKILIAVVVVLVLLGLGVGLYLFLRKKEERKDDEKSKMKNLAMATSGKIIEGYSNTPTPTLSKSANSKNNLMLYLKICQNLLGKDMPKLCYDLNKIDFSVLDTEDPNNNESYNKAHNVRQKISRIKNELLNLVVKKVLANDNIYDAAAVFLSYQKVSGRSDLIVLEYDDKNYPSKLKLTENYTVDQLLSKLMMDNELKSIIDTRFPNLKNNKTDTLTLEETGQLYYIFFNGVAKTPIVLNLSYYPPCDN